MEKEETNNTDAKEENKDKSNDSENISNEDIKDVDNKDAQISAEEEIISLKDKVNRVYAESENQRRRFEKEKEEAFEYGGFSFAKETLNLLDNLERSKVSLENDETLKNTAGIKKLMDHLDIINKDMISIFKKNNIEPIKAIGQKLDPNIHQAMMEVEDDEKEQGTIVQEIQKGFMMKNRLLRPSLVGVSKKKVKKNEKSQENQEKKEKN
tara:strand:+ start:789 stop:1418 length:630 start_codon:yes stop_codon:yes gene_type:complete